MPVLVSLLPIILYKALMKKQVWAPQQFPQFHPATGLIYASILFLCTASGLLIYSRHIGFVRFHLLGNQVGSVSIHLLLST